jgi:hypothetical protein
MRQTLKCYNEKTREAQKGKAKGKEKTVTGGWLRIAIGSWWSALGVGCLLRLAGTSTQGCKSEQEQ